MIFALWDYYKYRKRKGRYSDYQSDAAMGAFAFVDHIPEEEIKNFQTGDFIFTQRLNSFMSWIMMYITSSSVDHTGIYYGDAKIAHRTLYGAKIHSLRSFSKGARVLVVRMSEIQMAQWSYEFEKFRPNIHKASRFHASLPPKGQLALGGLLSIHGKYQDRFRLKLYLEFIFSLSVFCAIIWTIFSYITVFVLPILSIFFLIFYSTVNILRLLKKEPPVSMSHPDVGYKIFFQVGGLMFTRMGPITVTDLGLLPLKVVLGLARQGADDSSDDQLKKAGEFFRRLIKDWNIEDFSEGAENNNSNQQNDKKV